MVNVLSAEQLVEYDRNGIIFPIQVFRAAEVDEYRRLFEDLVLRLERDYNKLPLRQPHLHFRWAYNLATDARILDIVEDVIGPNILIHTSSVFAKKANDPAWTPWHQDGHYWGLRLPRLVSAWIALSESNLENGCVRVVPATHHARLPHKTLRTGDSMLASGLRLEADPDESTVVNVILNGGAISLHHVNLVHGSGPNCSDKPRIGFAVRYVAPEVSQELEHHRVALARGRDDYHNYSVVSEPPSSKIEESIESLKEIDEWIERVRLAITQ